MSTTALDIGTYTIKAISGKGGKRPVIAKTAETFNTAGIDIPKDDSQAEKITELINNFFTDHKLAKTDVRLSLPENVVSTKIISMPTLSDAELASAIEWQAEQHIPIPKEDLSLEYQVLFRPTRKDQGVPMRVLLVGVRKDVIERFTNIFFQLGIEATVLETQILSLIRSLGFEKTDPTTLVAHLGASNLNLALVHQGELDFVFTNSSGGQLLTKALEKTIGLDMQQAEEYKRTYGLIEEHFQGKVRNALLPTVNIFTNEMQKAIRFFINQSPQEAVKRIVLSGGTSQLPGLIEYISQTLGIEVLLASPFAVASGEIPQANHQAMTICMGLLIKEM